MTLTIFGFAPSTYTQTATMIANETGAEHRLAPLEFKKPSHFALHPYGRMPILEHGDVRLRETLAIATYIDDTFGAGGLQPREPLARARMFQAISEANDYGYPALVGGLHDDEPSSEALAAAGAQLKLLDQALAHGFAAGTSLTLADFFWWPMTAFAKKQLGGSPLSGLPALARWYETMAARPSVKKAA